MTIEERTKLCNHISERCNSDVAFLLEGLRSLTAANAANAQGIAAEVSAHERESSAILAPLLAQLRVSGTPSA